MFTKIKITKIAYTFRQFAVPIILSIFPAIAQSQCINTIIPSCDVYTTCFEKYCKCAGSEDEYLISFGKKYCEAFLNESGLSETGKKWRDSTLRCLQEAIVPIVPINEGGGCDCKKLKNFAFDTHVDCYTQTDNSVCDVPISDITKIGTTIVFNNSFINLLKNSSEGARQVKNVFSKCSDTAKDEDSRKKWGFFSKLLGGKVK